jgi:hypothetical protein
LIEHAAKAGSKGRQQRQAAKALGEGHGAKATVAYAGKRRASRVFIASKRAKVCSVLQVHSPSQE